MEKDTNKQKGTKIGGDKKLIVGWLALIVVVLGILIFSLWGTPNKDYCTPVGGKCVKSNLR